MSLNRYYGMLTYCTYLPFSIYAPDKKEALAELKRRAPSLLSDAEKGELIFHLTRIPNADRVKVVGKESSNAKQTDDKESLLEVA